MSCSCRKYAAWLSRSAKIATSTLAPVTSSRPDDCTWITARWMTRWKPAVGLESSFPSRTELENLVSDGNEDSKPTAGFQRVIQRAVIHVQSSGREEVTGANVLVAIFAERESHAAYFLQEQDMTRYDAVNYISHGIGKRPGMSEARHVQGADEDNDTKSGDEPKKKGDALDAYCVNLNKKAREGKIDPLIGRETEINRTI